MNTKWHKYFDKRTIKSGDCIEWQLYVSETGYGILTYNDQKWRAHRFSYYLEYGIVPWYKCLLHSCDNRKCVNPKHLSIGTQADNVADMMRKGRHGPSLGEINGNSLLKEDDIKLIRFLYKIGSPQTEIAKWFKMSYSAINKIVYRYTWKHID